MRHYVGHGETHYVHLVDGGLADNLGLRALYDKTTVAGGYLAFLELTGYTRFRRVLILVVNAQQQRNAEGAAEEGVPGPIETIIGANKMSLDRYGFETVGPSMWMSRLWLARTPKTPSVVTSFPGPIMSEAGAEKTSVPFTEQPTLPPRTHIAISSVAPCSLIFAAEAFAVLPNNVWVSPPSR